MLSLWQRVSVLTATGVLVHLATRPMLRTQRGRDGTELGCEQSGPAGYGVTGPTKVVTLDAVRVTFTVALAVTAPTLARFSLAEVR